MKSTYEFHDVNLELHLGELFSHEADAFIVPNDFEYSPISKLVPRMNPLEVKLCKSDSTHPKNLIFVSLSDSSDEAKGKFAAETVMREALVIAKAEGYSSLATALFRTEPFSNSTSYKFSVPSIVESMTDGLTDHFKKVSPIKRISFVVDKAIHFSAAEKVLEGKFQRVYKANGKIFVR